MITLPHGLFYGVLGNSPGPGEGVEPENAGPEPGTLQLKSEKKMVNSAVGYSRQVVIKPTTCRDQADNYKV